MSWICVIFQDERNDPGRSYELRVSLTKRKLSELSNKTRFKYLVQNSENKKDYFKEACLSLYTIYKGDLKKNEVKV